MHCDTRSRVLLALGFGLSWLVACAPLIWSTLGLESTFAWLSAAILRTAGSYNWLDYLNILGQFILRMLGSLWLPLLLCMLLLLPLLSLVWNLHLGLRRSLLDGLSGMLWPAILHTLLISMLLALAVFIYYISDSVFSGGGFQSLPAEILIFLLPALGAWIALPRAVDNLSAEHGLLSGSISGLLAMLAAASALQLAVEWADQFQVLLITNLACGLAGLLCGLSLPWLYRQDRAFWLELREADGPLRTFRLGPRSLLVGASPAAQARHSQHTAPSLRFTLSGLTLFMQIGAGGAQQVVYPPLRIHIAGLELALRSFDERDDWEELQLEPLPGAGAAAPSIPEALPAATGIMEPTERRGHGSEQGIPD